MPLSAIPELVRHFIFEHIDSVEQLDVLLFLRAHPSETFDARSISALLRSNPQSVMKRFLILERSGFVARVDAKGETTETLLFRFTPRSPDELATIDAIAEVYKQKPQKIFALIFSPLKKGREFADAFLVNNPKKDSDDG